MPLSPRKLTCRLVQVEPDGSFPRKLLSLAPQVDRHYLVDVLIGDVGKVESYVLVETVGDEGAEHVILAGGVGVEASGGGSSGDSG
jgi:hypothetical protein